MITLWSLYNCIFPEHDVMSIITGRGSQLDVESGGEDRLIGVGWDRSFLRCLVLIGCGEIIPMEKCSPYTHRLNSGLYLMSHQLLNKIGQNFLYNLYMVSYDIQK